MKTRPSVVQELRDLFVMGATPSRLMQQIRKHHPDESHWRSLVQQYFWDAFQVPLVRVSNNPQDVEGSGFQFAHLNHHLIPTMLQSLPKWSPPSTQANGSSTSWLSSLAVANGLDPQRPVTPGDSFELSKSWDKLDPETKRYIQELLGSVNGLYEKVLILSRLAECLQQQVVQRERQLEDRHSTIVNDRFV